ncbi:unnamed protein product [Orchesella dallaii]|uniref:NACHT domain-containing protein n=1 Tax=Orchesella dallaii TaxID=48710 RepID=A0ABP1S1I5_9HEXA
MDAWQKEHITRNLPELIELTDCNVMLMAELNSFLSKSDEDSLTTIAKFEGRMAQAMLFYKIAVTRPGMYAALTIALYNTKQSGAHKILLQGATIHRPNEALPGIGKYALTRIVNFQGQEICLQELLEQFPEEVIERLTGFMGDMHDKLIDNKQPILINNSVPPDIPYYIPRRLTSSQLVGNQGADLSTNQIESLTLRFIVLVFEKDYDQITRMTSDPVHLLDYKENRFTWLKSHGDLSVLQKYISDDQIELTEHKLLESCLESEYPVCISDTPGMGKTVLLASLARSIMQRYPKRIVRYIVLRELVPLVQRVATPTMDEEYLMHIIFESASEYALGKKLIKELLKFDLPVLDLMFDGFDEVLSSQVNSAKIILRTAAKMKSVRMYVTTRPHMRDELERTLGVLGYNIQPFGLDEQIDCLVKYWKQEENKKEKGGKHSILKMSVLEEFAKECLAALESNMNDSERGIAGIPLQCKMLAEVYQEDAIKQATPDGKVSNFDTGIVIRITSIFDMYQKLIDMRFQKISKFDEEGEHDKLKSLTFAHMSAAVQLLFPDSEAKLNSIFAEDTKVDPLELCGLGILEKKHTSLVTPRFIHRTFAEYFLRLFVVRMLHYHDDFGWQYFTRRSFLDFLYNTVLVTDEKCEYFLDSCKLGNSNSISAPWFSYSVICYFINAHLKHFKTKDAGKSPWTNDASKLFNVLAASIVHDYPAVFQQLSEEPTVYPTLLMKNEQVPYLTMLSAKRSSIELFKMTHNYLMLYLQTEKPNFIISSDPEFEITPLHIAMERGHFAITDFILNMLAKNPASHEPMYVVHCCVRESLHDKISTIESKVQIIRLVFSKFPSWINESISDGTTPLLQSRVHSKLLETLLECGADVNKVSNSGCVLHRLVENKITPEVYHEVLFLFLKHDFKNFNCIDIGKRTPLHRALQNVELLKKTLQLFQAMKADFHAVDEEGDSVFFFAVRSKRSVALLKQLISPGCNWKKGNYNHDNLFHVAAKHGNHKAFEYFLEHKEFELSMLSAVNKKGFIPFMQALSQGKGLTMRLIKTMEEKGFEITKKLASQGLKALLCNKYIMAWELDKKFISVTDYLIQKGGTIECRNGVNPWQLEATQKNMDKIAIAIKLTEEFRKHLQGREVFGFEAQERLANEIEMESLNEDLIAELKAINHPLIAAREIPREDTLKSIPEKLIKQQNSFEQLCVSLIACKQIQSFTLLKQCLQSDLQESVKFVTQMNGINSFVHSQKNQVAVLRSHSIELSITRLRNTIDPDMPVIQNKDLSGDFHGTNKLIYQCKSADNDVVQTLNMLETKSICVCSEIIGELDNSLILVDDIAWEDLSTDFQDKLNLWTGVRSEICDMSFVHPLGLKNKQLVAFILEQEKSSTELHHMIDEFAKGYSRHEHLSWIPEQIHGEITPSHIAVTLGYIATTKFLLSSKSQSELQQLKYLIHFCVAESASDDSDTIVRKKTIIGLLIKKNKSWIDESFYQTETPPLLQSRVNEKLLDCLVKSGADIKIALEHGKGLTVRLLKILEENGLQLARDLASKTFTNLVCTKRIMGWELNSDFVKVAEFLLENGAQIICRNGKSAWEVEAVKANIKRIAEATLCNHALVEQLERRGFHDVVRFTDPDLLYNILQTLGHKKSFEYLCTSLIACNQVKPYILLKLCLQSDGNQAAKFITPPIGIAEFLENKACNVAVLQSCNVELSIARIKETVDKDVAVLTEVDIHRESYQFKEHYTNMLVLECGTATEQTIQHLASIHRKVICVYTEVSVDLTKSEACKILYDEFSWKDLSPYYKKVFKMSVAARHEINGILHVDYKLLRNEELVKFIIENKSSNVMKLTQHYKNEYLKTIPTFFSAMIPNFSPTPLHIAVERGHAAITEYLLASSLYSASEDLKYLVHCCVAGSISDSGPVITNKLKIIELISQKNFQLLDESLPDGRTPLLQSSVHSKLVECLINQGADINVQTKDGKTFIIKALSSGHGLNLNILKLMEKKGHIISQQQASEGLSALFSSKNTKPFGLNQDFTQILDYLTEKSGNLARQNSIWESEVMKNSLPKIVKATQSSKKLLEELQGRGILTALKMEEFSNQTELLFKSLQASERHDSFAAICSSLVACNQIEPFVLLKQCFRTDITDRIMFVAPQQELADFVLGSKHDFVIVLRSLDFELTIERIKDTIEADVFHVNDETLHDELPTTSILIYKCEKATLVDLYQDKITWKDLSEELKYDLLSCIWDADIETIGKYSELNDEELVNFIRQNLLQFIRMEKQKSKSGDKYLSKDIFQFFHVDKFAFIGISRDELNEYIKFDHKIGGTGDDIDKLDLILIENKQSFEEIFKQTSYNVHLIEHKNGRFKVLKTRGKDYKLEKFIAKNHEKPKCDNITVCTCGEHEIGSDNLIWNVFRMSRKDRTYWINILDIIEQVGISDFKLGDSLTLYEVTKLFNSTFSGLNSSECWKKYGRQLEATFFNYLEFISSLHYEVISSVLRELPEKTEDFWTKWLHACVLGNHFNLLKLGINSSISMKQTESELKNLLCLAVKLADKPVIDLLIEQFPLHNKQDVFGFEFNKYGTILKVTILHIAPLRESYSVIHDLITNKRFNEKLRNKNMRNITAYCVRDSANNPSQVEERKLIIRLLLEHDIKFHLNLGGDYNDVNEFSKNILHFHAKYMTPEDYHKLAETLFARGDLKIFNAKDALETTPLYYAVEYVELLDKTMELFSDAKADFNAKDNYGDTVLIKAVDCNRSLCVLETLIHFGADFTIRGKIGYSVLHRAARRGNVSALRYFITQGCEINAKNVYENTPLHNALNNLPSNLPETVKILIEHGADVNAVNKRGETTISLAEYRNVDPRTVAILKNAASRKPK